VSTVQNEKLDLTHEPQKGRILIVDDDQDLVLSLVDILASRGYQVEVAHSAKNSREKAEVFDPQVVLLDIRLGHDNGIDLIAQLKERRPSIFCVMMTAYAAMDTAIEALHRGAYDYLQKPLDVRYLLATLERCFERLRLEREKAAAEEGLRESEERYRILFENAPVSLWVEDLSAVKTYIDNLRSAGIRDFETYFENHPEAVAECAMLVEVVDVNQFTVEMYQAASKERLLVGLDRIFTVESYSAFREQLVAIADGETRSEAETVNRTLEGEERHVVLRWFVAPGHAESLSRVFLSLNDITSWVRVEEALRQRNRELALLNRVGRALNSTLDLDQVLVTVLEEVRRLLDIVACSIWLTDPETGELVCQQAIGPVGETVRGWRLAPGEGLAGWVAHSGESLIVPDTQTEERYFHGVARQTGMTLRSILSVPLRVKDNTIGVLQVMDTAVDRFSPTDLTLLEPLAASAAIAIDNARLVEALRGHTAELQARNEELDAYAHTVAHDLKGPLGYMVGFAQVLEQDHTYLSGQELRHYLRTIAQSGHKMSNIIDELLLLAGLRKMKGVDMHPLDMVEIVAEAQGRLAGLMEEVLVNYFSNAIKYGGEPPRVELGFDESASQRISADPQAPPLAHLHIRFWVRDNGAGLTAEEQGRLFRSFERLDRMRAKGHGLGLSIVRRIVKKLGGQVGVESEIGTGSTFWFTLPTQFSE
jgi:signal transduction histidine kinase/ActR/RegA family two-component response regulator